MPRRSVKVVFMGSPEFAVTTLEALIEAPEFDVVHVVTQPDRPKGRGKKLFPTPVKECATARGIPVVSVTPDNYTDVVGELTVIDPDFVVVAAFGVILKSDMLNLPRKGCINLHASLLPRYRGVSPVQAAILAGDERTGCTTMMMDEGVDTGDVLLAETIAIGPEDTAGRLEQKLAQLGAPLVVKTLRAVLDGTARLLKQDDTLATRTRKIKKEHGGIDWTKDARSISRQVRAMLPWPTAYTSWSGRRLIILEARAVPAARTDPGVVLSVSPLMIGTGDGGLEVLTVKVEGKREMPATAFVAGYRLKTGDRMG